MRRGRPRVEPFLGPTCELHLQIVCAEVASINDWMNDKKSVAKSSMKWVLHGNKERLKLD